MDKHEQLFENMCCELYEDVHAGFIIDFQHNVFPLFNDYVDLLEMNNQKHSFALFESVDGNSDLNYKDIMKIFKSAVQVSKNSGDIKRALVSISSEVSKIIDKYSGVKPAKNVKQKIEKVSDNIKKKDISLEPVLEKLKLVAMNDKYANVALAILMAAAFAIGTKLNDSSSIENALNSSIEVMSEEGQVQDVERSFEDSLVTESIDDYITEEPIIKKVNTLYNIIGFKE